MTTNELKRIVSYKQKKFRIEDKVFLVEGRKMLLEANKSDYEIMSVYVIDTFVDLFMNVNKSNEQSLHLSVLDKKVIHLLQTEYYDKITVVNQSQMKKMSSLEQPDKVITLIKQKETSLVKAENNLLLALDNINNPGNLGTIIRLAAWFGVKDIVCSNQTVDYTNAKVLQSSMGAVFHTNITYTDLNVFLKQHQANNIYAALLQKAENIYTQRLLPHGIILLGNESHGISQENLCFVNHPITIPCFADNYVAESLNVSVACGIILSEFRRQTIYDKAI